MFFPKVKHVGLFLRGIFYLKKYPAATNIGFSIANIFNNGGQKIKNWILYSIFTH
jgi:hypothetical protein